MIPGVQVADIAGGMVSAFGILAALMARERTGRGQFVDISMFDVMMGMLTVPSSQQFAGKAIPVAGKYGLSGAYPFYNIYRTSDGRFMTLGALASQSSGSISATRQEGRTWLQGSSMKGLNGTIFFNRSRRSSSLVLRPNGLS